MPEEITPTGIVVEKPKFSKENLPKTKEEWNSFRQADPVLWGEVTQENYDRTFREKKELEERFTLEQQKANNLSLELNKYKTIQPKETVQSEERVSYSYNNLPKTKEDWDDLAIEDPTLAMDLRAHYNNQISRSRQNFEEAQATSRKKVQSEHPDMYMAELDENGQPKKDSQGKIVLKVDGVTGEPYFNPYSEKGKLWSEIEKTSEPLFNLPHGPEMVMAAMERRLRDKGTQVVNQAQNAREQMIREGQVVLDSVTPPKKVEVKFASAEEKLHAEKLVSRGLYRNLEEFVINRDSKDEGYYDENRFPNFGNK